MSSTLLLVNSRQESSDAEKGVQVSVEDSLVSRKAELTVFEHLVAPTRMGFPSQSSGNVVGDTDVNNGTSPGLRRLVLNSHLDWGGRRPPVNDEVTTIGVVELLGKYPLVGCSSHCIRV